MTNARVSKKARDRIEELTKERNALLDVLNGILQKSGGVLSVEHEHFLGKMRHPVYTVVAPNGIIIKLDTDQHITETDSKRLFVVPTAQV